MATNIVNHHHCDIAPSHSAVNPAIEREIEGDGRPTRFRPATHHSPSIHTYYVPSDTRATVEYVVQRIRKPGMNRWQCSCPQFFFRCASRRRNCKHIRLVRRSR